MAEYIDREAAILTLLDKGQRSKRYHLGDVWELNFDEIKEAIASIPAADVRPVVKASWQYKTITVPGGKGQTYAKWRCTACKGKAKERTNFCPNCGADMRLDDETT